MINCSSMKKKASFLVLLMAAFSFSGRAADIQPEGTMLRKLQRGFVNIALSPTEITTQLAKEKKHETFPPSWMLAFARGGFYTVGRVVTGAYEIVTFPLPLPAGYAPLLQPEFPWQHLDSPAVPAAAK